MSLTTRVGLLAGAGALAMASGTYAGTDQDARIAELEAKVAELSGDNWLTEQRSEEIRGLVQDVLADADTRASLLNGMQGGYDNGFVIGSSDGNFSLRLNGQLQARYIYNNQDAGTTAIDESRGGFENTRTKLMFSGNVGGPDWMYYMEGDFGQSGEFDLDQGWVGYDAGNGWVVKMGQMKVPMQREWLVHSSKQLAVERSLVGYDYSGGFTQGIAFSYTADSGAWRLHNAFSNGADGGNSAALDYDTEYSLTSRFEYLASGNWGQFDDFTSPMGSEQGMLFGVGVHHQKDEYGTLAGPEEETTILNADWSLEMDGANLFAQFSYADFDIADANPLGLVVQGGFYFNEKWEGFARYEYNDPDTPGAEDTGIITVGVNGYYNDNVKMTADIGFSTDTIESVSDDRTGYRLDAPGEDGQFVLRTQLQLTF